jgi:uncharacterized membrane protein YdjX (TVP38/TMEM64 family)
LNNPPVLKKPWVKLTQYIFIGVFFILAVVIALNFNAAEIEALLQKHEKTGLFICFMMYPILGLTLIPSEPVTLLVLAWKGPIFALAMATVGNTLAAYVEFYIGGSLGDLANFEQRKHKLPFNLGRLPINSAAFLFFARMIPGFGPKFVSIAGGMYRVSRFTYLWTTLAANLLGASLITLGGTGIFALFK